MQDGVAARHLLHHSHAGDEHQGQRKRRQARKREGNQAGAEHGRLGQRQRHLLPAGGDEEVVQFGVEGGAEREHGAREAPGYPLLKTGVRTATRLAIWLSERV